MIRIDVEGYCHSCMDFNPDVTAASKCMDYDGEIYLTDTIIRCEYRRRCDAIRKYFERQQIKSEEAMG